MRTAHRSPAASRATRFLNENVGYYTTASGNDGLRRRLLEWDLARVCQWVEVEHRDGESTYHGLNFRGDELINVAPSSEAGTQWAYSLSRFNADGLPVWTKDPSGRSTKLSYYNDSDGSAEVTAPGQDYFEAPGAAVLMRGVIARQEELTDSTGEIPTEIDPATGIEAVVTNRVTLFEAERVFQQITKISYANGDEFNLFYDYQQTAAPSGGKMEETYRGLSSSAFDDIVNFGVPPTEVTPFFRGVDFDGDGSTNGEFTKALALETTAKDTPAGFVGSDLGRRRAGHRPRVIRERAGSWTPTAAPFAVSAISDILDPSSDLSRTELDYYATYEDAVSGALPGGSALGMGPLAEERTIGRVDPDDPSATQTVAARYRYDAWGGASSEITVLDGTEDQDSEGLVHPKRTWASR